MGNIFSGRRRPDKKGLTEDSLRISADEFVRDAVPCPWRRGTVVIRNHAGGAESCPSYTIVPFGADLVLFFDVRFGETSVPQAIPLHWTPARDGGRRLGFACPTGWQTESRCGRPCRLLYLPPGTHRFACRDCHNLTYRSSQEHNPNVERLLRDPEKLIEEAEEVVKRARRGEVGFSELLGTIKLAQLAISDIFEQLSAVRTAR